MESKLHKGKVKNIDEIAKDTFVISIETSISSVPKPGQFVSILCKDLTFRRPFCVFDFEDGILSVCLRKKGKGTQFLSGLNKNDEIDFSGFFGNGFTYEESKRSLLIGAGIGVAPLFFLKKFLKNSFFISGFKERDEVFGNYDYLKISGSILDDVEKIIYEQKPEKIYSCAPLIVLQKISEIANEKKIECEVSLEKVMACSIGVCRGCVIEIKKDGKLQNASVCKDGPVFSSKEVLWPF